MEQFDMMLKEMAGKEGCIVPDGFDERMRSVLDGLPQERKERLGAVKTALIAAAACALLVGTAFAASPGLREMLAEALGGFAPYAQEQDSGVYTWNGFEFEVLAALADENTVRVYTRVTDLEGRPGDPRWTEEGPWLDIYVPHTSVSVTGWGGSAHFVPYDTAAQTRMAVITLWGKITDDLTGAELRIDTMENRAQGKTAVTIPLEVEITPSRTVLRDIKAAGIPLEELRVSPLGITALGWGNGTGLDTTFRVCLKDGTEIETESGLPSGHGHYEQDFEDRRALIWNFADPVELDQIAGIWIGEDYFPME